MGEENQHGMVDGVDGDNDHSMEDDIDDDGTDKKVLTSVKLFAIQKREVQRLTIKYSANHSINNLPCSFSTAASASSQEDLLSIKDALSDIDATEGISEKLLLLPETNGLDESLGSSITAVSNVTNVTLNGNYG